MKKIMTPAAAVTAALFAGSIAAARRERDEKNLQPKEIEHDPEDDALMKRAREELKDAAPIGETRQMRRLRERQEAKAKRRQKVLKVKP